METSKIPLSIPENFNSNAYERFKISVNLICKIIDKKIKPSVLDIGCGNGGFIEYIKNKTKNHDVIFIGIDNYQFKSVYKFSFIRSNIENKIPLEDKSVDVVFAGEIIEHIKNTDFLIKEIHRIMKDDGDLIITTPNLASYLNRFLLLFGYQPYHAEVSDEESGLGQDIIYKFLGRSRFGNNSAGHLRLFTMSAMKDFLFIHRFTIINHYPSSLSSYSKKTKRVTLVKIFYIFDHVISKLFPSLSTSMIYHAKKQKNL